MGSPCASSTAAPLHRAPTVPAELQSVSNSLRGATNRAAAPADGREQCSGVRRRGGRGKRSAGRRGATNGLSQRPKSVAVVLVQHSLQAPACQRLGVSSVDLDSPIDPSLPLAVSAHSRGQGSTCDGGCSCVLFCLEFVIALSLILERLKPCYEGQRCVMARTASAARKCTDAAHKRVSHVREEMVRIEPLRARGGPACGSHRCNVWARLTPHRDEPE